MLLGALTLLLSLAAGQRAGTADWGSGLCRMLLQGVREQREGRVPPDHAGLGQQGAQEPETQQLQAGTEAGVTDAWQDRLPERHRDQERPSQELLHHVRNGL